MALPVVLPVSRLLGLRCLTKKLLFLKLRLAYPVFFEVKEKVMKEKTHPNLEVITVKCSCGAEFLTRSTKKEGYNVEICSNCHPFYTGKTKIVDTAGRIEKFNAKYKRDTYTGKK